MVSNRVFLDAGSGQPWPESARIAANAATGMAFCLPQGVHSEASAASAISQAAIADLAAAWGVNSAQITPVHGLQNAFKLAFQGLEEVGVSAAARLGMRNAAAADVLAVDSEALLLATSKPVVGYAAGNQETGVIETFAASESQVTVLDCSEWAGRMPRLPEGDVLVLRAGSWAGPMSACFVIHRKPLELTAKQRLALSPDPSVLASAATAWNELGDVAERENRHRQWTDAIAEAAGAIDGLGPVMPGPRLPHLLSISVTVAASEMLARELDRLGFAVGSGSACNLEGTAASHVLEACGMKTANSIRVGLPLAVSDTDVQRFIEALPLAAAAVR